MRILLLILLFFSLTLPCLKASVYHGEPKDDEKKKGVIKKEETTTNSSDENEEPNSNEDEEEEENENDEELEDENYEEDSDTLSSINFLKKNTWNINDSIFNIPAYDVYCNWNTKVIHPYKFDLTKKSDTSYIHLQSHLECEYDHPFEGEVTSNFGPRNGRFHYGIDIKLNTGDTVVAAFEGTVRIAQESSTYGNVIVLRHNNGLETFYAHLDKMLVEVGDHLNAGEVLGLGGNTGRSSGSHLHFEVRFMGAPINPNEIISFDNYSLKMNVLPLTQSNFAYLTKARVETKIKGRKNKRKKYHTVRKGDTLSKIARKYGVNAKKLSKINRIKLSSKLRPGKKIRLA